MYSSGSRTVLLCMEVVLFCSVWMSYCFALCGSRTFLLFVEMVLFSSELYFFLPGSTFFLLSVVLSSYQSPSYLMATFRPCRTFYSLFTCRMPFRVILVERNSLKINTFYVKLSSLVFLWELPWPLCFWLNNDFVGRNKMAVSIGAKKVKATLEKERDLL